MIFAACFFYFMRSNLLDLYPLFKELEEGLEVLKIEILETDHKY